MDAISSVKHGAWNGARNANRNDKNDAIATREQTRDRVEISNAGYDLLARSKEGQPYKASSGNDVLGISKGDKDGEFNVSFSDSAVVNRAVSRGYISVNGKRMELSEEDKKSLAAADKQAEENRKSLIKNM